LVSFKLTIALRGSSAAISVSWFLIVRCIISRLWGGIDALRGSSAAISIVVMPHCQVYCRQAMRWHLCSQGELGCYICCCYASLAGVLSAGYELESMLKLLHVEDSKEFLGHADAQKKILLRMKI